MLASTFYFYIGTLDPFNLSIIADLALFFNNLRFVNNRLRYGSYNNYLKNPLCKVDFLISNFLLPINQTELKVKQIILEEFIHWLPVFSVIDILFPYSIVKE